MRKRTLVTMIFLTILPLDLVALVSARRRLARLRPDVIHTFAKTLHFPVVLAARSLRGRLGT